MYIHVECNLRHTGLEFVISSFIEFLVAGLAIGSAYALMAMPMSLTWTTTRTLDFAVGGYAVLGGMAAAAVGSVWGIPVGLALGAACGAILGLTYVILGRRRNTNLMAPALASVGLLFALVSVAQWQYGVDPVFARVFPGVLELGPARIRWVSLVAIGVVLVVAAVLKWTLLNTPLGVSVRACADSSHDAPLVGIAVQRIQFLTFVASGTLGAGAGLLVVATRGLSFDSALSLSLLGLGALIVFGMRGPLTALAGAMTLGVVDSFGSAYLPNTVAPIAPLLFILAILAVGRFDNEVGVARP